MVAPVRTDPPWQPDDPWFVYLGERQALLRADAAVAAGYGADHPEVFGGVWMDDRARLQVGLTVLDPHAARVSVLLEHAREVDIVAVARTAAEVDAVLVEVRSVMAGHPDVFSRVGLQDRQVHVHLRPSGEAVARQLYARHGDALHLTVGALRHPLESEAPPAPEPGPVATIVWPELKLSTRPDTPAVAAGADITGLVTITNLGRHAVRLDAGQPLPAQLIDATGHLAGRYTGVVAGTGIPPHLAAGESRQVRFLGGTAGTTTYLTPPGRYDLVVLLDLIGPQHRGQLLTPPIPIDVRPA